MQVSQATKSGGSMELSQTLAQPISLLHYSLYVHNLQVDLESSGLGARVGDTYTGGPTYAEDIATSPEELQSMLAIVQSYAHQWRSTAFTWTRPRQWCLAADILTIEVVEHHLHLGLLHSTKSTILLCSQPLWLLVRLHLSTNCSEALPGNQPPLHAVWCLPVEHLQD